MVILMIFAPPHYLSKVKGYSQLLLSEAPKRPTCTKLRLLFIHPVKIYFVLDKKCCPHVLHSDNKKMFIYSLANVFYNA